MWCFEGNLFCGNIRLLLLFAVHSQPVAYPPAALSSRVPAIASTRSAIFLSSFFVLPSPLYLPSPSPLSLLHPLSDFFFHSFLPVSFHLGNCLVAPNQPFVFCFLHSLLCISGAGSTTDFPPNFTQASRLYQIYAERFGRTILGLCETFPLSTCWILFHGSAGPEHHWYSPNTSDFQTDIRALIAASPKFHPNDGKRR